MSNYWPFFLLLLIPYIWWTQRKTRVDLSSKHLRLVGIGSLSDRCRCFALALTQPVIYRSGALVSVMYLLDISQSVLPADIQAGIQWIQETNDSGKPDHARYIPFGANACGRRHGGPGEDGFYRRESRCRRQSFRAEPTSKAPLEMLSKILRHITSSGWF